MKYLLFFTALFLFFGCSKTPTVEVAQKPLPEWIMNPPISDGASLYGVGEGKDRESALANALNSIASTLSVSVKSEQSLDTKVHNSNGIESYTKDDEQKIALHVREMRLSGYEVLKVEKIGFNSYATLVKLDKSALFNTLKDETDKIISQLKKDELTNKSANILEQYYFYENSSNKTDEMLYKSQLLKILNPAFNDTYITNEISALKKSFDILKSKISFSVTADKESQNLIAPLKSILSARGFKISQDQDIYHLHVSITSNTIYSNAYGFTLARSAINIDIKDAKNQIVKSKKVDIIGQSSQGEEVAKQDVAIKFKQSVQDIL